MDGKAGNRDQPTAVFYYGALGWNGQNEIYGWSTGLKIIDCTFNPHNSDFRENGQATEWNPHGYLAAPLDGTVGLMDCEIHGINVTNADPARPLIYQNNLNGQTGNRSGPCWGTDTAHTPPLVARFPVAVTLRDDWDALAIIESSGQRIIKHPHDQLLKLTHQIGKTTAQDYEIEVTRPDGSLQGRITIRQSGAVTLTATNGKTVTWDGATLDVQGAQLRMWDRGNGMWEYHPDGGDGHLIADYLGARP